MYTVYQMVDLYSMTSREIYSWEGDIEQGGNRPADCQTTIYGANLFVASNPIIEFIFYFKKKKKKFLGFLIVSYYYFG